jgi:plasmid stabilization system protein ParE
MATVEITQRALADLERLFDFVAAENPQKTREQVLSVRKAFELLADRRRELILSRGRYGQPAKYCWLPAEEILLILAVRHQLEAAYEGEWFGRGARVVARLDPELSLARVRLRH